MAEDPHAVYVIELSSFQLDNMYEFKADIAILLNITPDHLDRYNYEMQNYVDAKFRIIRNQTAEDAFIFWNDDPIIAREIAKRHPQATLYPFAETHEAGVKGYTEDKKIIIETSNGTFTMEKIYWHYRERIICIIRWLLVSHPNWWISTMRIYGLR